MRGGRKAGFTNFAFFRFLAMASFGVLTLVVGTTYSIYDMIYKLSTKHKGTCY